MAFTQADYDRLAGAMGSVDSKQPAFHGTIYGPSGVGKTVLAASIMAAILPKGKGALHIDIGEGYISLQNHPSIKKKILTRPFTTLQDIELMVDMIEAESGKFKKIAGVILDEGSSMAQIETDRQFEARQDGAYGPKAITDSMTPEWPDYNASLAIFRRMTNRLFEIPNLHVIIISHEATEKNKLGAITKHRSSFSPKTGEKVKELMHLVARLSATDRKDPVTGNIVYDRVVQVHPTGLYDAKSRIHFDQSKFPAEELPGALKEWLEVNGNLLKPDDVEVTTVRNEPDPVPVISGSDPMDVVDSVDTDEDELEDLGALIAE